MDIERFISFTAFYLVAVDVFLTLIVMLLMQPRTLTEWASVGKEVAFNLIIWRSLWTIVTGQMLPQPAAAIFWSINAILLSIYFVNLLRLWGPVVWRALFPKGIRWRKLWISLLIAVGVVFLWWWIHDGSIFWIQELIVLEVAVRSVA